MPMPVSWTQQVAGGLRQARRIASDPDRLLGKRQVQGHAVRFQGGAIVFTGQTHQLSQVDDILMEGDLAAGDARHVEQIVEQAAHVGDLAVDDLAGPLQARLGARCRRVDFAEDVHGIANGAERVAQLVCQHGEKVILLAIRVLQGFLGTFALDGYRQHVGHGAEKVHFVVGERARRHGVRAEHAVVPARLPGDGDAHAAGDPVVVQARRAGEARLRAQVGNDHRRGRAQRVAGVRARLDVHHGLADEPALPADAGPER
jgi:hypothetical protein